MVISNWDPDQGNFLYYNQIVENKFPDLECTGYLSWDDVTPDSIVTGSFTVENIGDSGSELNWEVAEFPEWGDWKFTPESGTDLTPEMGPQTVEVMATAPSEKNKEFTGKIKVVNTDNTSDFCEIDIYLRTPRSKSVNHPVLSRFMSRFQNAFPILRYMFTKIQ